MEMTTNHTTVGISLLLLSSIKNYNQPQCDIR